MVSRRVPRARAAGVFAGAFVAVAAAAVWRAVPVTDLWETPQPPLALVAPPHLPPDAVGNPLGPVAPPEPLPELSISIGTVAHQSDREVDLHTQRFPSWTPSARSRANLAALVNDRLGVPGVFENARCDDDLCSLIADTQFVDVQGRRMALVTAVGVAIDENGALYDCHVCAAALRFFVLSPRGTAGWRVDTSFGPVAAGEFARPGRVRIVALGPATPGWTVEDSGGAGGENYWRLRAFAVEDRWIREVLDTPTGEERPDNFEGCTGGKNLASLQFDPTVVDAGFYRLKGVRVDRRWKGRDERIVARVPVELRFRTRSHSYRGLDMGSPWHFPDEADCPPDWYK